MTTAIESIGTIAAHELRAASRGRMVPVFAALFTLLTLSIALAGLAASGQLMVQGFTRTAVSLLSLSVYLLPLLGVILGASAFGGEDGGTELLLAQPVDRGQVILGRFLGLAASLVLVAGIGFGVTGLLISLRMGLSGGAGYLLIALGTTGVGLAWLGMGILLGVLARRRGTAVGYALGLWFLAAVVYDLACIGVLQVAGTGQPGPWLLALLALNPIDGIRTLGLLRLGADVLLGPTGASLQRLMGEGGGAVWVLGSLGLWLVGPLSIAVACYRRRDF